MWLIRTLFLVFANSSITAGCMVLVLLALRPLLKKLPAQHRAISWLIVWFPVLYRGTSLIPNPFFSLPALFVPRTAGGTAGAEYIPYELARAGSVRDWVLPFGIRLSSSADAATLIEISDRIIQTAAVLWFAGVLILFFWNLRQEQLLRRQVQENARYLNENLVAPARQILKRNNGEVSFLRCAGLPASFVLPRWVDCWVCLQDTLTDDQLRLVVRHEAYHITKNHSYWKTCFAGVCTLLWFQPLVWLAFWLFCKDVELAADEATLADLSAEERKAYAQLLLDLASPKQLPRAVTAFGETDAAVRIRAALAWRPVAKPVRFVCLLLVSLLLLSAVGMPDRPEIMTGQPTQSFLDYYTENTAYLLGVASQNDEVQNAWLAEWPEGRDVFLYLRCERQDLTCIFSWYQNSRGTGSWVMTNRLEHKGRVVWHRDVTPLPIQ